MELRHLFFDKTTMEAKPLIFEVHGRNWYMRTIHVLGSERKDISIILRALPPTAGNNKSCRIGIPYLWGGEVDSGVVAFGGELLRYGGGRRLERVASGGQGPWGQSHRSTLRQGKGTAFRRSSWKREVFHN